MCAIERECIRMCKRTCYQCIKMSKRTVTGVWRYTSMHCDALSLTHWTLGGYASIGCGPLSLPVPRAQAPASPAAEDGAASQSSPSVGVDVMWLRMESNLSRSLSYTARSDLDTEGLVTRSAAFRCRAVMLGVVMGALVAATAACEAACSAMDSCAST
jgi:hypothetical protein